MIGSSASPGQPTSNTTTPIGGGSGSNTTAPGTGSTGPFLNDIALQAVATASSAGADQGAGKAIDGTLGGYTPAGGNYQLEWASNRQREGAWLQLSWPAAVSITGIALADRPNLSVSCLYILVYSSQPNATHFAGSNSCRNNFFQWRANTGCRGSGQCRRHYGCSDVRKHRFDITPLDHQPSLWQHGQRWSKRAPRIRTIRLE